MSYTFDLHVRQNNIQVSDLTQAKEKVQTNRLCQAKSGPSFFRHMRSQKHSACFSQVDFAESKGTPKMAQWVKALTVQAGKPELDT